MTQYCCILKFGTRFWFSQMIPQPQLYVFPRLSELICVLAHVKGVTDREMLRNIVLNVNKSVVFLSRNSIPAMVLLAAFLSLSKQIIKKRGCWWISNYKNYITLAWKLTFHGCWCEICAAWKGSLAHNKNLRHIATDIISMLDKHQKIRTSIANIKYDEQRSS